MLCHRVTLYHLIVLLLASPCAIASAQSIGYGVDESQIRLSAPANYLERYWMANCNLTPGAISTAIHLGDSHVQSGYLSDPIRSFMEHTFGLAGPGWVGGYLLARSNAPRHATLSYPSGRPHYRVAQITDRSYLGGSPTGTIITSTATTDQYLSYRDDTGVGYDRIVVYRPLSSRPLTLGSTELIAKGSTLSVRHTVAIDTLRVPHESTIQRVTVRGGSSFYGLSLIHSDGGALLHTIGYNGASYSTLSQSDLPEHIGLLDPQLLILSLGTNDGYTYTFSDSEFSSRVRDVVRRLKAQLPHCAIILTTPVAFKGPSRRRGRAKGTMLQPTSHSRDVALAIRHVAESEKVGYIDLHHIFGGNQAFNSLYDKGFYSTDGIHLSVDGYTAVGQAIATALSQDFRNFLRHR